VRARTAHQLAGDANLAVGDALEAGDGPQQGRLAATGWADQHTDVARAQTERDFVDGGLGPARVLNAQFGDLDEHGVIVDAYNSHLHQRDCPTPWPCAGSKICSYCYSRPCWSCRCWPCWLPGCNGTARAPRSWAKWRARFSPGYVWTSLGLCLVVGIGVALVGGATAAAVTLFDFPGRRTFEWALLLPLAMPAYVVAYAYTDYLQFSGPLQSWLRSTFGPAGPGFS
jgi:ABC-type sugar transport system permease subunit